MTDNPLLSFLESQGVVVLDGGLATALEARGCDIDHELWSAKVLLEAPELIREVHLDFLEAGADCITTSTYQASVAGFGQHGLEEAEARRLFDLSVTLAREAREEFWNSRPEDSPRRRPLVAGSIGPYGAFLADGSEYRGRYRVEDSVLREFHRVRWETLASAPLDLLACETLPCHREVAVLLELLADTPDTWAWMSFSCKDGAHLHDGTPVAEVVRACDRQPRVAAIGVNCTAPQWISPLIRQITAHTDKPVLVYPNSGEGYDPVGKSWIPGASGLDIAQAVAGWKAAGAVGIGGCCRIGSKQITAIRTAVCL